MSDMEDYYKQGGSNTKMRGLEDSRVANLEMCFKEFVPSGSRILDIGCGDMHLKSLLPQYIWAGVDIETSRAPDAMQHDIGKPNYPFLNESYDAIVCSEVMEHLFRPEVVLKESHRILKAGGILLVTVPNSNNVQNLITGYNEHVYNPDSTLSIEHIRGFSAQSLGWLMQKYGFTVLFRIGNSPHMLPFFETPREVLYRVLKDETKADQLIGQMFPELCTGITMIGRK